MLRAAAPCLPAGRYPTELLDPIQGRKGNKRLFFNKGLTVIAEYPKFARRVMRYCDIEILRY